MYDQMTRLLAEMLREKWHQGDTESTVRIAQKAMEEVRTYVSISSLFFLK